MIVLRSRLPFSISIAALLALVLGLIVTQSLFVGVSRLEHEKMLLNFRQQADLRVTAVQNGLEDAVQVVTVLNQLFATVEPVSREQFHTFTQPLLQRYPSIQAFNFHRLLTQDERPAYEAAMQQHTPGFVVTELVDPLHPARIKPSYSVVDYLEPMAGNEAAFGLDVSGNRKYVAATRRALETGQPASTELLNLAQGAAGQRGFLMVMPVYRRGSAPTDSATRSSAMIGDTAAVFLAGALVEKILNGRDLLSAPGIAIQVYASARDDPATLVYGNDGVPVVERAGAILPAWLRPDAVSAVEQSFETAGQSWHIVVSGAPAPFTANHFGSLLTLIGGILFSLLAAAYLQTLAQRSRRIQRQVDKQTLELRRTNDLLIDDIAARKQIELALQLRERAIEASSSAILIARATAPDYPIEYVNPAFEQISGFAASEVIGRSLRMLEGRDSDPLSMAEIRAAIAEQREAKATVLNHHKNGAPLWCDVHISPVRDQHGVVSHFVAALHDITSMKHYEAKLQFQASRDTLTGLANRNMLSECLNQAIAYAARYGHSVWVVFVDLDRFKFVNDTLGHRAGDLLLQLIAERLLATVRETDTVARLGGDEFVLILREPSDAGPATASLQRIMDAVALPLTIEGHEFFLTCSLGVAVYPADGEDTETLIKCADIAMYRAKEIGRNNFQFYTPTMNEQALERLRIEGDLRNALERDEFMLLYQPQVNLRTGQIVGMEALLRWQHPQLGMVSPLRFIGLAEETGMIVPIGAWVIRTACAQNQAWQQAGLGALRVSVNLSARQFSQQDLMQSIAAVLQETGMAPHLLEIELTESLVMTDVEHAIGVLRELKALGVLLSIDDFGTGYSSLSYLKRFPIDVLKIDQSFVRDITVNDDDAAIAVAIISLAHSLKLEVIAEGVETEQQLAFLRQHDCDEIQGYLFSQPVPAQAFEQMLRQGKCLPPQSGQDSVSRSVPALIR